MLQNKKYGLLITATLITTCCFNTASQAMMEEIDFLLNKGMHFSSPNKPENNDEAEELYKLGELYHYDSTQQDYDKAIKYYQKAAEQGHHLAQYALGCIYQFGREIQQDHVQAHRWYKKAAKGGHVSAQVNLAGMYQGGLGVTQSHKKAFKWYEKAAEQGNLGAQSAIGSMYQFEEDIQNYPKIFMWCEKAAQSGDVYAQFNLGKMYQNGHGIPQNYDEALKWYKKAVDQGYVPAQIKIGDIYYLREENDEAFRWYTLASQHEEEDSAYQLLYSDMYDYDDIGICKNKAKIIALISPFKDELNKMKIMEWYDKVHEHLHPADPVLEEEFPIEFFPSDLYETSEIVESLKKNYVSPLSIEGIQVLHGTEEKPIKSVILVAANNPVQNPLIEKRTKIFLKKITTIEAARELLEKNLKPAILNSANSGYPGFTQEKACCEALMSSRYRTKLINASSFVRHHKDNFPYDFHRITDYIPRFGCIYTPVKLESKELSVIAAAAYNLKTPITKPQDLEDKKSLEQYAQYTQEMERKMRAIFLAAQLFNHRSLVLSMWAHKFNNNPLEVARLFKTVIQREFNGIFEEIIFAIPEVTAEGEDKNFTKKFRAFEEVFDQGDI